MGSPIDRFTERDITTLSELSELPVEEIREAARSRPWQITELLSSVEVFDGVMDRHDHPIVSPALLFTVLVHRAAAQLLEASYVEEWVGVGSRLPVYDIDRVHAFVGDPARLGFLAQLLAAFVAPPRLPLPVEDPLDLQSIAMWLDVVDAEQRITLLRRMGDVALFLAGVFPDRAAGQTIEPAVAERLGKTVGMGSDEILTLCEPSRASALDPYDRLGSEWYAASADASPLMADVARRFPSARRVLNHLTDRFLYRIEPTWTFAA